MTELRKQRYQACLKQKELAEMLGISASYLCMMENGSKPLTDIIRSRLNKILPRNDQ